MLMLSFTIMTFLPVCLGFYALFKITEDPFDEDHVWWCLNGFIGFLLIAIAYVESMMLFFNLS